MTNTEFLQRFQLLPTGGHVLCALSGGRDSVYLLHRLLEWVPERQLRVSAAHFNHHLRGEESDRDEAFVRALCSRLQVPLTVGHGDVQTYASAQGMGMEEAARTLRYAFLEETRCMVSADVIATAHHADDLAETMLFQLARGAGTKGLSGIPPRRGNIIRPILLTTREEIDRYLRTNGINYVEDSTNALENGSRNVLRHQVMPVLKTINPEFVSHAAQSAMLLREDEQFLQGLADRFVFEHPVEQGIDGKTLLAQGPPVASRVIRTVWGAGLTYDHVQEILSLCSREGLAYAYVPGGVVRYDGGKLWRHTQVPEMEEVVLQGESGETMFGEFHICWETRVFSQEIHNSFNTFHLKCENMGDNVTVSARRDGDRVKLAGASHTKKLKQLFLERKLTQPQRATIPVFRDEQGIVAVYGFGIAQRCVPEIGDKIISIQCNK